VRANAVKVAIVIGLTFAALVVFQANTQVLWGLELVLGVGNMIGARLGTHVAVRKGTVWARWFVIAVVLVLVVQLLGVFEWVRSLLG
jgi:uncharacterized protein